MAWQAEREEFDMAKGMFADAAAAATSGGGAGTGGPASSSTSHAFSSGWVYEEKPISLPSNRESLLPNSQQVVTKFMNNQTDKKVSQTSNVNWVVDTAMSQMMQECGKKYLNFVGGRISLEE